MAKSVYIDGRWSDGGDDWFEKTNPATGETSWEGQASSPQQVTDAIRSAREAQLDWGRRPQHDRTTVLERYAEELTKRSGDIAAAISSDMGKTAWEANGEAGAMTAKVGISIKAQVERAGVSFSEAAFGIEKEISISRSIKCDDCNGTGANNGAQPSTCDVCHGHGEVRRQQGFFTVASTCPKCHGSGQIITDPCRSCHGEGHGDRRGQHMDVVLVRQPEPGKVAIAGGLSALGLTRREYHRRRAVRHG